MFRVTSPGSSLKAGLMLMDRRRSCLAEPAAFVATHVNTPASPGCVRKAIRTVCPRLHRDVVQDAVKDMGCTQANLSPLDD